MSHSTTHPSVGPFAHVGGARPTCRSAAAMLAVCTLLSVRSVQAQPMAAAPADSVAVPVTGPSTARSSTGEAGPTLRAAAVAAHARWHEPQHEQGPTSADARAALAAARQGHASPAAALMIVGGSAVVLGLLVGGSAETPLVVGGAVVGLIGLYQYLL